MSGGTATTFKVLCKTNNEAANAVLVAALDASNHEVKTAAVRALAKRRSPAASRELIHRWHTFSDRLKSVAGENASRIEGAIRDAVLSKNTLITANGCEALIRFEVFDLLPALVNAAEDTSNPEATKVAETLLFLSEILYEELASPRDYRDRRDPKLIREYVLGALQDAVARFETHHRLEILEAFLLLADNDNRLLKRILRNLSEKAYLSVANLLTHSPRPGVIRLLVSYLDDRNAPNTVHSILSRRKDVPFIRFLLKAVNGDLTGIKCLNLRKIESFTWLRDHFGLIAALNSEEQQGLVNLVMESGMSRLKAFEVVEFVLLNGSDEGRQAASAVLDHFNGADANSLILTALEDDDPVVQANVVHCLRERGIPGAMHRLIELVESPHEDVREAARASLEEFNFDRFLAAYDTLDPGVRRSTGPIVRRVDPKAISRLRAEFRTLSRTRKHRAIAMAISMACVRDVETCLIGLTKDDDQFLRAEAAQALAHSDSTASRNALRALLLDRSSAVKETAEQTLQSFVEAGSPSFEISACDGRVGDPFMNATILQLGSLVGQGTFHDMGDRFRNGGAAVSALDILLLTGALLVATIAVWLLSRYVNRRDAVGYNSPRDLFRELCSAHELEWSARRLLVRLAKSQELADRARLFVEPQRFKPKNQAPAFTRHQSAVAALAERLFANGPDDAVTERQLR